MAERRDRNVIDRLQTTLSRVSGGLFALTIFFGTWGGVLKLLGADPDGFKDITITLASLFGGTLVGSLVTFFTNGTPSDAGQSSGRD